MQKPLPSGLPLPRRFQSLREGAVVVRVLVPAKVQEIHRFCDARQSQPFSPGSKPFAEHLIPFAVVIAKLQMLLEVFLRVAEVALCLDGSTPLLNYEFWP
jgi:hypothetical protein